MCKILDINVLTHIVLELQNVLVSENPLKLVSLHFHQLFILNCIFSFLVGEKQHVFSHDLPYHAMVLDTCIVPLYHLLKCKMSPLIVYGGDDSKLHLLIPFEGSCKKIGVFSGQEDWIFTVDWIYEGKL